MAAPNIVEQEAPKKDRVLKFKKWVPKKWRPEYERVVALSAAGKSNKQIGEIVGFTKEHVSNILNLPQAEALMDRIIAAMNQRTVVDIPNELQYIAQKTVSRLKSAIDNDKLFEESPFALIDRGMKVVEGLRHLQGGGNGAPTQAPNVNNGTVINFNVPVAKADDLIAGLQKANEVKQIHAGTKD